jgi:hypothetical protein
LRISEQDPAKEAKLQALVFTFVNEDQVENLRGSGATVITIDGHLMGPVPVPIEPTQADSES